MSAMVHSSQPTGRVETPKEVKGHDANYMVVLDRLTTPGEVDTDYGS